MKIIFAQGNPEPEYTESRHNTGFNVLNEFAKEHNAKWSKKPKFNALTAEITLDKEKLILVKPTTFYNETGLAAKKILDFYKISKSSDFLVIHDDLALPFGTIRIRQQGSDGGNNGIKSLNANINMDYARIRIGILNEQKNNIADTDFVLGKFSLEEAEKFNKTIIPQVIDLIKQFCKDNLKSTSHRL